MYIWISSRHNRWSALLVSLMVLVLVTVLTTVFLEVIWDSSKNVQWIEASNVAYYRATGIVEEQLMDPNVSKSTPWNVSPKTESLVSTGRSLVVATWSSIMPSAGYGNSPYDPSYNLISLGQPLQIVIPNWIDWTNVSFEFRVPHIGSSGTGVSSTMTNSWIILWTVGYSGASLYASGETQIFRGSDINLVQTWSFAAFSGITNSGSSISVNGFYTDTNYLWTSGSRCMNYACTLKLSMIRPVLTSDGRSLPFLEYRVNFGWVPVPSQFMTLNATAYAYGFQRNYTVRIPQITTNTALDFAVLQ